MRRCVTQRDGFREARLAIDMITATACKVLYGGPRSSQRCNEGPIGATAGKMWTSTQWTPYRNCRAGGIGAALKRV
jgi:hypothetical protein